MAPVQNSINDIGPRRTILYKFATRGRPDIFKRVLEKYYNMMSGRNPFYFVVTVDRDDPTMNNPIMLKYMVETPSLRYFITDSKTKIEAINANMEGMEFEILVVVSDDMVPQQICFDDTIVRHMNKYFPDMDGALHYNDGCCGVDRTITLSIMGRKLYKRFGYIYHPDYKSFYCDNEFTDVVRAWGKVQYLPEIIIKHEWKGGGQAADLVYKRNSKYGEGDDVVYARRKAAGFPIDV
jgi:hypothetical protein